MFKKISQIGDGRWSLGLFLQKTTRKNAYRRGLKAHMVLAGPWFKISSFWSSVRGETTQGKRLDRLTELNLITQPFSDSLVTVHSQERHSQESVF
jgi:hypothetical protein